MRLSALGNPFWPLVGQYVSTGDISGRSLHVRVRALHSSTDSLQGSQRAILKLRFYSAGPDGSRRAFADCAFMRTTTPTDRIFEGRLAAVAPEGTVAVSCEVLLNSCGLSTGSIVIDDLMMVVADD